MQTIVTDEVLWSVGQSLIMIMSPAKTGEPLKMPFGLRTRVGPMNHVLVLFPHGKAQFRGGMAVYGSFAVSCAKTAELIKMSFGMWTWVGPRKHLLDGGTLAPSCEYD